MNAYYGKPVGTQRLIARGKLLCPETEDGKSATLFDYGIGRNEVIQLHRSSVEATRLPAPGHNVPASPVKANISIVAPAAAPALDTEGQDGKEKEKKEDEKDPAGIVTVKGRGQYRFIGQSSSDDNVSGDDLPQQVQCRWFRIWTVEEGMDSSESMEEESAQATEETSEGEKSPAGTHFVGRTVFSKRGSSSLLQSGTIKSLSGEGFTVHWEEEDVVEEGLALEAITSMLGDEDNTGTRDKKVAAEANGESISVLVEHQMPPPVSTLPPKSVYKLLWRSAGSESTFALVDRQVTAQVNMRGLKFEVQTSSKGDCRLPPGEYAVGVTILCNEAECKQCRAKPSVESCKVCGCQTCLSKGDLDKLLMCDECNLAYHMTCMEGLSHSAGDGNMEEVPKEDWYCPKCFNDPRKVTQGKISKPSGKKMPASALTTKNWGGGMACVGRTKTCTTVKQHHLGAIPGIKVGTKWQYRIEVSEDGIHRPHVAGMSGTAATGCQSIVLSGGYSDDEDEGEAFLYTGSGGRDLSGNKRTAKQSMDQTLERQNAALAKNCNEKGGGPEAWKKGKPVRVIRASKLAKTSHGDYAPSVPEGWTQCFRYDGLYKVVKYGATQGKSGHRVYRYLLRRDDPEPAPWTPAGRALVGSDTFRSDASKNEKAKRKREREEALGAAESGAEEHTQIFSKEARAQDQVLRDLMKQDTSNLDRWEAALSCATEGKPVKDQRAFLDKVEQEFACIVCMDRVSGPITTPCGHNYCQACFKRRVKYAEDNHGEIQCDYCRTAIAEDFSRKPPVNDTLKTILKGFFGDSRE